MERVAYEKSKDIQGALASANDQIIQLKATVTAMRDEMERTRMTFEEDIQRLEQVKRDEVSQLQHIIQALRKELEDCHANQT
jgi:predicted phage gp36 major capsid-like protein